MTSQDIKKQLATIPGVTKVTARVYAPNYKGSMRGYTSIVLYAPGQDFRTIKDLAVGKLGKPAKTFYDVHNF